MPSCWHTRARQQLRPRPGRWVVFFPHPACSTKEAKHLPEVTQPGGEGPGWHLGLPDSDRAPRPPVLGGGPVRLPDVACASLADLARAPPPFSFFVVVQKLGFRVHWGLHLGCTPSWAAPHPGLHSAPSTGLSVFHEAPAACWVPAGRGQTRSLPPGCTAPDPACVPRRELCPGPLGTNGGRVFSFVWSLAEKWLLGWAWLVAEHLPGALGSVPSPEWGGKTKENTQQG